MAENERKKINITFNGLRGGHVDTIAQETLAAAGIPAAIAQLTGARQIALLRELTLDLRNGLRRLQGSADYAALGDAKGTDTYLTAFKAIAPETNQLWNQIGEKQKALNDLKFHLYLHSSDPQVRLRMMRDVDHVIAQEIRVNNIGNVTDAFWHDLLYLSTFGGKITRDRTDVDSFAFEFNAQAKGSTLKHAVPWDPMDILFEAGLTKGTSGERSEDILTTAGKAVLVRFNELHGTPKAQRAYKAAAPGSTL